MHLLHAHAMAHVVTLKEHVFVTLSHHHVFLDRAYMARRLIKKDRFINFYFIIKDKVVTRLTAITITCISCINLLTVADDLQTKGPLVRPLQSSLLCSCLIANGTTTLLDQHLQLLYI